MTHENLTQKMAFTLTTEELANIIKEAVASIMKTETAPQMVQDLSPRYEYSSLAAAKRLGISVVTFQAWKNRKLFRYSQIGRKCIFDIPAIMEDLACKTKRGRA